MVRVGSRPLTPLVRTIIQTGRPRDQAHTRTFYISTFPSYFQEFFLYSLTAAFTRKSEVTEPLSSKDWSVDGSVEPAMAGKENGGKTVCTVL